MSSSTAGLEVRELRRADYPAFERVVLQGLGHLERVTGLDVTSTSQIRMLSRAGVWYLVRFLRVLGLSPLRILVGVDRGTVVGTATLLLLPKSGYVAGVATDSAARGRGVATRVIEGLHRIAARKGRGYLVLDVESENETAIRVYRRLSYAEVSRYDWHIGPPPAAPPAEGATVHEVAGPELKALLPGLDAARPLTMRTALPASTRLLTHLEAFMRPPGTKTRTWTMASGGRTVAVARGFYLAAIQTGFCLGMAHGPAVEGPLPAPLVGPCMEWFRALGASRVAIVVPNPDGGEVGPVALGLPRAVSTTLMVRTAGP
jgi:ribosomal protein S18 acetylase RimI-like enzyme